MKRVALPFAALLIALVGAFAAIQLNVRPGPTVPDEILGWSHQISNDCESGDQVACEQAFAVKLALSGSITEAADRIHDDAISSDAYRARCHDVSHLVGRIATEVIGIEKTLTTVSGGCGGGLLHGAEEQWGYGRTAEQIEVGAAAMCDLLKPVNPTAVDGCAHAIGHALFNALADPFEAAHRCPKIFQAALGVTCSEGSVMAYVDQLNTPLTETELTSAYGKCPSLGGTPAKLCHVALGRALVRSLDKNIKASMEFCSGIPDSTLVYPMYCAMGVGHEAAYQLNPEPERMVDQCLTIGGPLLDGCLAGGAKLVGIDFLLPDVSERMCALNPSSPGWLCREVLDIVRKNSAGLKQLEQR